MSKQDTLGQRALTVVIATVVALVLATAIVYGLYRLALTASHETLAILVVALGLLLGPACWACYWLGGVENRGVLAGLGLGVNAVVGAANKTAEVKVATARRMRRDHDAPAPSLPALPRPQVISGNTDVIDAEIVSV